MHFWQNDQGRVHATAVTQGGWTPDKDQHRNEKVNCGEENSPSAPAGTQTHWNLLIMSLALLPTSYPGYACNSLFLPVFSKNTANYSSLPWLGSVNVCMLVAVCGKESHIKESRAYRWFHRGHLHDWMHRCTVNRYSCLCQPLDVFTKLLKQRYLYVLLTFNQFFFFLSCGFRM